MARRRTATLALAALALILSGCGAAHAGATPAQRSAAIAQTDNGDTPPEPAPVASGSPSPTGSKSGTKPAGPAAPTKSSGTPPSAPSSPSGSGGGPGGGHGPFGSLTSTGTSAVALTFDDGPGGYTNEVLDLLAQHHIKATFCMIGRQVAGYPDVVRRIVAEGHTLCNHTWSHDLNLRFKSPDQIRGDLQRTNDAIHAIVPDAPIKYFREPGGNWGANTVSIATSMGMASIHWSIDPQDWRVPPPQAIINNVCGHTAPGGIVLMHDGGGERHNTVVALRTILPNLAGRFTLIALPTS
jgi:peptidoglycan/xylan/chitin deacetylase (PgdA/CDA1 family)